MDNIFGENICNICEMTNKKQFQKHLAFKPFVKKIQPPRSQEREGRLYPAGACGFGGKLAKRLWMDGWMDG